MPDRQSEAEIVSLWEWVLTLVIAAIPLIGFIMLFVWGFGGGTNPNKANWARATLLILVLGFALSVLIFLVFGWGMMDMHSGPFV